MPQEIPFKMMVFEFLMAILLSVILMGACLVVFSMFGINVNDLPAPMD